MPIVKKTVRGGVYLYYTHWAKGKLHEEYIGPADDANAMGTALRRRLVWLNEKKAKIQSEIDKVQSELWRISRSWV